MKTSACILIVLLAVVVCAQQPPAKPAPSAPADISGMYTFLRDGEFVQIDVEGATVSGFISRYGDSDSDRGAFLDQIITKGSLEGKKLTFTTRAVHGVAYEFKGTVERGEGKTPGSEAYYVLKGTLTQTTTDANKNTTAKSREVVPIPQPAGPWGRHCRHPRMRESPCGAG